VSEPQTNVRSAGRRILLRGAQGVRRTVARRPRLFLYLSILGPGVITANAGNDAGGIATFASVGADHGYKLLWVLIPLTISLGIVQEMCARMGAVTGKGLADLIREHFGVRWTALVMLALLIANGGVTVSEFVGIAAATELFGVPRYVSVPIAAGVIWWLVVKGTYQRVERVFLAMSLVFLGYLVSAFLAHPSWGTVARDMVHPTFEFTPLYLFTFVAVIGTTISPYMQVFIQSSVVEKGVQIEKYALTRADVWAGTVFAILIVFFIVISTAATLNLHGEHVESAAQAARALRPLAGGYAEILFGVGLFGASMLAAGVVPLATAYSITEAFGFEKGVSNTFREAPIFLGIFTFLVALGALIGMMPGLPLIRVLLVTQVINGMLLPVVLIVVLRLVNNRDLMGDKVNGPVYNVAAWITTLVVCAASVSLIIVSLFSAWFRRAG
jgi:NRAMP (natural resistance-associated macrophage protein)-like metal ion transporter